MLTHEQRQTRERLKREKREAFLALKEAVDNGRLIPSKRPKIPAKVRKAVAERQAGLCAECACDLPMGWHVDHEQERDLMGPDHIDNYRGLCPPCHIAKTSARATDLAKVHRLHETTWEGKKPSPRPIPQRPNPWPSESRKIRSRNSLRRGG